MFKCIGPDIPRANTAIFVKERQGVLKPRLRLVGEVFDEGPSHASGYISTAHGDSGGPYWTTGDVNKPTRAILVAIHNSGAHFKGLAKAGYSEDPYNRCMGFATKITENILRWIKIKSGMIST